MISLRVVGVDRPGTVKCRSYAEHRSIEEEVKGVAYTLDAIQDMLEWLAEPARSFCADAALTGSSASDLRGLRRSGETQASKKSVEHRKSACTGP
jgi:hypothetical protein